MLGPTFLLGQEARHHERQDPKKREMEFLQKKGSVLVNAASLHNKSRSEILSSGFPLLGKVEIKQSKLSLTPAEF
jgi:hypothetical protein